MFHLERFQIFRDTSEKAARSADKRSNSLNNYLITEIDNEVFKYKGRLKSINSSLSVCLAGFLENLDKVESRTAEKYPSSAEERARNCRIMAAIVSEKAEIAKHYPGPITPFIVRGLENGCRNSALWAINKTESLTGVEIDLNWTEGFLWRVLNNETTAEDWSTFLENPPEATRN